MGTEGTDGARHRRKGHKQTAALHPFTNRLYAVGWGGVALYARDLDPGQDQLTEATATTGDQHVLLLGPRGVGAGR